MDAAARLDLDLDGLPALPTKLHCSSTNRLLLVVNLGIPPKSTALCAFSVDLLDRKNQQAHKTEKDERTTPTIRESRRATAPSPRLSLPVATHGTFIPCVHDAAANVSAAVATLIIPTIGTCASWPRYRDGWPSVTAANIAYIASSTPTAPSPPCSPPPWLRPVLPHTTIALIVAISTAVASSRCAACSPPATSQPPHAPA